MYILLYTISMVRLIFRILESWNNLGFSQLTLTNVMYDICNELCSFFCFSPVYAASTDISVAGTIALINDMSYLMNAPPYVENIYDVAHSMKET